MRGGHLDWLSDTRIRPVGEARSRLKRFHEAGHSECAYCGGTRKSTSIDHVPPTAFFKDKRRPPLYETPACSECHKPFSDFDSLFSLFAKIQYSEGNGDVSELHVDNLIRSSKRKFDDVVTHLFALFADSYEARLQTAQGVERVQMIDQVPTELLIVTGFIAARTTAALYYKLVGHPLPVGSVIQTFSHSNTQISTGQVARSLIEAIPNYRELRQGRQNFGDQFAYRFFHSSTGIPFYCAMSFKNALFSWGFIDPTVTPDESHRLTFEITGHGIRPTNRSVEASWVDRGVLPEVSRPIEA